MFALPDRAFGELPGNCSPAVVRYSSLRPNFGQDGVRLGAADIQTKDAVQAEDAPHHLAAGLLLLSVLPVASGQRAPFSQ
jgi:hypothetical protein